MLYAVRKFLSFRWWYCSPHPTSGDQKLFLCAQEKIKFLKLPHFTHPPSEQPPASASWILAIAFPLCP